VIVGSHPHVIQAVDTLKNEAGHETVCIYSVGNSISNQRKEIMSEDNHSGHTEDGVVFEVTFDKYSDGKVVLSDVNALPTWVDMRTVNGEKSYNIIPLDLNKNWTSFSVSSMSDAKASYSRTLARIGEGLNEWRLSHGKTAVPLTAN
ncbi:MAG: CapA family protein, partial [Clostridia bacterium]|nr:CapA family protein [Clostridia bacterium]